MLELLFGAAQETVRSILAIIGLFFVIPGFIQCFFGYRVLKLFAAFMGFLAGLVSFGIIGMATLEAVGPGMLMGLVGGLLLALLAFKAYKAAVCLINGINVFLASVSFGFYSGLEQAVRHFDRDYLVQNLIGGGALLGRGLYLRAFARRCRKYVTAIGKTDDMDIDLIARRVGRTYDQAVRDMDRMIDKGVLGDDAYLDLEQGCFLRYGSEGERRREEARTPKPDAVPPEAGEGFSGILRDIRAANDRIADPVLSAKIDRLEQITGQILKEVEEHPEKRARMGTFFDYYLPTTQKLLDTYADFEETGVEGENLRSAKQRIERTMDKIVEGFAQQLDSLFSADAMDVASDIKVMETMLERDTGSAARDFGYDKYQGEQQSSAN